MPAKAGVYEFLDNQHIVLYVGKAKNLKARVSSYFINSDLLGTKTRVLVSQIKKIRITIVESELEALLLEAHYIKKYQPKYNIRLTDNKSYVRIRITMKDPYPKVLFARRIDDKNSIYFGPYPSSASVRIVLKTIRRVFPFQSVPNHLKRICLYNHLGLCPCPPVFDSPQLKKEYNKNIRGLIRILSGESRKILKELEKKREVFSKDEVYEKALQTQKKINALSLITSPFHRPFEYEVNPNLRVDIRQQELDELKNVLNQNTFDIKELQRLECYDISNTQGTHATGSMVVFVNGEKDSSKYRRFKIRKDGKPDDFAMMQEMLKRRFTHDEWNTPDLIIIDGGKGQVSSAMEVMTEKGLTIPLIGLAKREESIVIPIYRHSERSEESFKRSFVNTQDDNRKENFIEVTLPKNAKALHILMRIRDEAHRFAITYHKKLRSKHTFT